jgi:hypothetical protein
MITGTIYHPGGNSPWAAATVKLTLMAFFGTSTTTYPGEVYEAVTDAAGQFSMTVAVPTTGSAAYRVALPSGESFSVNLQAGGAITLEELVAIATDPAAAQNTLQTLMDIHEAERASTTLASHVELATVAEAQAGTDTERAVTPAGLPLFKPGVAFLQTDLGGNPRGTLSMDLQFFSTADDQVPSGDFSVALGEQNKVTGDQSIALGIDNIISGKHCWALGEENNVDAGGGGYGESVAIGYQNTVDADDSVAIGLANQVTGDEAVSLGSNVVSASHGVAIGANNVVSGSRGTAIGFTNTASGQYGLALGAFSVADKFYQEAFAGGKFAANGDAQSSRFVVRKSVLHNSASWFELFLGSSQRMTIATDTVWTFSVLLVGTTQGCTKSFGFRIEGVIENDGGIVTLLASTVTTLYDTDDTSFDARTRGDDTNKALVIEVQDADGAGNTVRWVANVQTVEVTSPA